MACRYSNVLGSWGSGSNIIFKSTFPYLTNFALSTYLEWAKQDPVSEKEIKRNEAAYALQNNRNPFIDHQTWIFDIWDQTYQYNSNTGSGGGSSTEENLIISIL